MMFSAYNMMAQRPGYGYNMYWQERGSQYGSFHAVMALVTWVAIVSVLFALARYLWKKGDKLK